MIEASQAAVHNSGQAAEELLLVRQLQSWGTPIIVSDNLPALGYAHIRERIEEEVQRAVAAAVVNVRGNGSHPGVIIFDELTWTGATVSAT